MLLFKSGPDDSPAGADAQPGDEHHSSVGPFEPSVATYWLPVAVHDWRVDVHRYIDNRPLLVATRPELREYKAVYVQSDAEIGLFSDEVVVNCAP